METITLYLLVLGGVAFYIWSLRAQSLAEHAQKKIEKATDEPSEEAPFPAIEPSAGQARINPGRRQGSPTHRNPYS